MKNIIIILVLMCLYGNAQSQSLGFMPYPQLNTTQRNAATPLFDGQVIVNSDSTASTNGPLQYWSKNSSTWKSFGSGSGTGFANPMTTIGDGMYGGASGVATRLAGNTTTARLFWTSQGTGSAAQAPTLSALVNTDIPLALQNGTTVTAPAVGDSSTKVSNMLAIEQAITAYGAPKLLYALTSKTQVINSTTATTIVGFSGSPIGSNPTILANALYVGRTFKVQGWAFISMGGTADNGTLSFYLGTAGDSVSSIVCPTSVTTAAWYEIIGVCRTTGTSGTVDMQGKLTLSNGVTYNLWNTASYTVNTTIANTFNMFWTFTVANASNAFTNYQCNLTIQ